MNALREVAYIVVIPVFLAWLVTQVFSRRSELSVSERAPTGASFGAVELRVKPPGTSGGIPEPLIISGMPGNASLVFVRYMNHGRAKVGVEFWGLGKYESEAFELPAENAPFDLTCFLPTFFPAAGDPSWGKTYPSVQRQRNTEYVIEVNGVIRLQGPTAYNEPKHSPIYYGANPIGGTVVANLLTGQILIASQAFKEPGAIDQAPNGDSFGAISVRVQLPGNSSGLPEPLVVCGVPGKASLMFLRLMGQARAKVGVEFWGAGKFESDAFDLPAENGRIEVTCFIPALFPEVGDPKWGSIPPSVQAQRNSEYMISVNGTTRLAGRIKYEQPKHSRIYLGANPVGGSFVTEIFSGRILKASQAF